MWQTGGQTGQNGEKNIQQKRISMYKSLNRHTVLSPRLIQLLHCITMFCISINKDRPHETCNNSRRLYQNIIVCLCFGHFYPVYFATSLINESEKSLCPLLWTPGGSSAKMTALLLLPEDSESVSIKHTITAKAVR